MMVIVAVTISALAVGYVLSRRGADSQRQLTERRGEILTVGVQIVCGDCSGDGNPPLKTYLDRFGSCHRCGGRSYVLASVCAQHMLRGHLPEYEKTTSDVCRQPVGSAVRLHAVRIRCVSS